MVCWSLERVDHLFRNVAQSVRGGHRAAYQKGEGPREIGNKNRQEAAACESGSGTCQAMDCRIEVGPAEQVQPPSPPGRRSHGTDDRQGGIAKKSGQERASLLHRSLWI